MNPFEDVIHELSMLMEIPLQADAHQSCLITFPQDEIGVQVDLDTNADRLVVGTQLGRITPGPYRERIFLQAMRANGTANTPRGVLAFSEKNDTLVLFQFLSLTALTGEKLHNFIQLFKQHAKVWKEALATGDLPQIQEDVQMKGSGMYGLKP